MKAIVSDQILFQNALRSGAVLHKDGTIIDVVDKNAIPSSAEIQDVGKLTVLPGLVDTHVHINEPGRTEWEGFNSATKAAAAGGITTVVDMPLNCIPVTTSLDAFNQKLASLTGKLWIDCGFHGGVVPGNVEELPKMANAGVRSFKAFMIDSGISEFQYVKEADLKAAMPVLAKLNCTLLVHAEVECSHVRDHSSNDQTYKAFLATRPAEMENKAIELIIKLSKETNCRVHIVHLSSASALPLIHAAKTSGVKITAETCPHYLTLNAEDIPDGDGRYKCMPPIREQSNNPGLWKGLLENDIDFIVSDHSPCTPALKKLESKNLREAWGGISSLQFGLPLIWTEMRTRKLSLSKLCEWMSQEPTKLVGLERKKGQIAKGFDADFVVFDSDKKFKISKDLIFHRHKETPYEGRECFGEVQSTWLRGTKIFEQGKFIGQPIGATLK